MVVDAGLSKHSTMPILVMGGYLMQQNGTFVQLCKVSFHLFIGVSDPAELDIL